MGRGFVVAFAAAVAVLVLGTGAAPAGVLDAGPVATNNTLSTITSLLQKYEPSSDGSSTTVDPLPFGHTIHVVDRDNKDAWKIDAGPGGAVTFEQNNCGGSPPLPSGALHLFVAPGDSWARLRSTRYHRTYLRDLTRLDYWACDQKNNGQQWPYMTLDIDWDGNNTVDDLIFFEPAYQNPLEGGLCGASSNQGPETLNTWQFWDGLRKDPSTGSFRACWWSVADPTFQPGDIIRSLSEYIAQHPNAAIVNVDGNHGGVQIVHGFASPSDTFDGWVDAFTIGKDVNGSNGQTDNSTITYDYQAP
jgi:hypothetical protein